MSASRIDRPHLSGLLPEDVASHLRAAGVEVRDDEARRILTRHLVKDARTRPIARRLEDAARERFDTTPLELVERAEDPDDGFVKYLFRSPDGALSEAIRIPLEKPGRFTVCLSSQVGCAMDCAFCATGRLGLTRSLEPFEIVEAFRCIRDEAPGRVTGAVFMGQGEPFASYDRVLRAADILRHPCGGQIRGDAITISSVGLVPQIRRFAREAHPYRLIVSFISAIAERRAALLPGASRWSPAEVAHAVGEYARGIRGPVTVAWVLLGGVNDGPEEADALRRLFPDTRLRVSLIDVNDPRPDGYRRASDQERDGFVGHLRERGIPVIRRYSGGIRAHAACGMLASRRCGPESDLVV